MFETSEATSWLRDDVLENMQLFQRNLRDAARNRQKARSEFMIDA